MDTPHSAVLAAALGAVDDAVAIAGPDGAIVWVNAAYEAITGLSAAELAGTRWPDQPAAAQQRTVTEIRDPDGTVTGFVAVSPSAACEELKAILRSSQDGFVLLDLTGRILDVNEAACRVTGYSREELLGFTIQDVEAQQTPADVERHIAAVIREGSKRFETRHRRRDGSLIEVEVSVNYLAAGGGKLVAFLRDISARKKAEQSLQFERAQLLSIFDGMPDLVYVAEPASCEVLFVNRSLRSTLGKDPVGGLCHREIYGFEEPCSFCTNPQILTDRSRPYRWEFHHPALDRTFELADQIVRWPDGRDVRLEIATDITARKRAEASLRNAHQLLDTILQAAPVAIVAVDSEGRVQMWNRHAETMSGWTAAEVLGGPLPGSPHDEGDPIYSAIQRVNAGETLSLEAEVQRKDGSTLEAGIYASPLRDQAGAVAGFVALFMDVSERRRLEAQLFQAQKLESVGRLAGGIAHDFNNLLTVINGYADLLMLKLDQRDPLYRDIAEIRNAGERASGLTGQLLAFSRKQVMRPRALSLNELIADVERMLQRLIGEDVALVTVLDPHIGPVHADPGLLSQVLLNLAVNARDAMPGGGRLTIETRNQEVEASREAGLEPGPYVVLTVSDTGKGMDENTRAHLFEPFFTTKPSGTGLGLSTVYGIVKQSGGHVGAESQPGHGTTFRVYLPRTGEQAAKPAAAEPSGQTGAPRGRETILVVEDQPEVRRLACAALRNYGYLILEAEGGEGALRASEQHGGPIHLLLCDVVMPGMSGQEVAEKLASLRPEMRVLFMSGYADDPVARRGMPGMDAALLPKPFTPDTLAAKVREILGPAGPARILVVDDDPAVRALLRGILLAAGYEVSEAADGKQAIAAVRQRPPHLVVTDLVMPETEGIETIRALRAGYPAVRIIAISGAFPGTLLDSTRLLGAHATLPKPITRAALLETVRAVLGG